MYRNGDLNGEDNPLATAELPSCSQTVSSYGLWNARFSPPAICRKELLENAYYQRGSSSEFVCWPIEFP